MEAIRFKPKYDKSFHIIWIPTLLLLAAATVFAALEPLALLIIIPTDLFTLYFVITSLFGYVELREETVFVKFGLIMKKEIPYSRIRAVEMQRKLYADSMVALKNSIEHVNIKYNSFDVTSVSVVDNNRLIEELKKRAEIT